MITYNEEQIEDARKGIEKDLQQYLGYLVPVGIVPTTGYDINFIARNLGFRHAGYFNELCSQHLARVAHINYDDPEIQ